MHYLTRNNNEGDGKYNLIPLIQLPLSPPLTGKQVIRVQRRRCFQGEDLFFMVPWFTSSFIITASLVSSTR